MSQFYPRPLTAEPGREPKHLVPRTDDYLTRADFETLYDTVSTVLHAPNPFNVSVSINFGHSIREWTDRIGRLLHLHLITFVDDPPVWLVNMHDASDGKVHVYAAGPSPVETGG